MITSGIKNFRRLCIEGLISVSIRFSFVKIFDRMLFFSFTAGGEGCVAMVYGVNSERMNCDHLFNLFCLYGNVVKVTLFTLLVCRL